MPPEVEIWFAIENAIPNAPPEPSKGEMLDAMERIAKADRRAIFYLHFGQWVCSGALYGARDVTPEKVEKWLAGKEEFIPPPPPEPPLWEGELWAHPDNNASFYGPSECGSGWRKIKVREVRE